MTDLSIGVNVIAAPRPGDSSCHRAADTGKPPSMPALGPLPYQRREPRDDSPVPGLMGAYMAVFRLFS